MTAAQQTTLAKQRAVNGHPDPYQVGFLGIGNESWDCGGNMTADYYLSQLKIYSRFVKIIDARTSSNLGARKAARAARTIREQPGEENILDHPKQS